MSDEFDGRDSHCLCRADIWQLERQVESLKTKLAQYTNPLNHNQIESLADDWCMPSSEISRIDEAFRKIREGSL